MKRLFSVFFLLTTLLTAASAQEKECVYAIDFSQSQTGWGCATFTGKPWAFSTNCFYDNGTYYSAVTMARNYSGASTAKYLSPAISLSAGTYEIRTLALKEGGQPTVTLSYFPRTAAVEDVMQLAVLNLTTSYAEDAVESHYITVAEDEDFYFAFDGTTEATDYHTPFLFRFEIYREGTGSGSGSGEGGGEEGGGEGGGEEGGGETETAVGTVVYSADLTFGDESQVWSTFDCNADGTTWTKGDGCLTYDGVLATKGADDAFATPAVALKADCNYLLSVSLRQSSAFEADRVALYATTDAEDWANGTQVGETEFYAASGVGSTTCNFRFIPSADGDWHFALHLTGDEANGRLDVTALSLTVIEKARPVQPKNFTAEADPTTETVSLAWTSPSTDTRGLQIVEPLHIYIYEDGVLVATLDDVAAGEDATHTLTPADWGGEKTYRITAAIGEMESAGAEQTLNLDDFKGDEVLVQSFADLDRTSFADWYTESLSGNSVWAYGYKNVIEFNYQLGQKENDWLVSPGFPLQAGARYIARYELQTQEAYFANITVTLGNAQSVEAQTQVIREHGRLYQNGLGQFETPQFQVSEDGTYFIGFHISETECTVFLRNLEVYEVRSTVDGITSLERVEPCGEIYSLDGRRLAAPRKGVNIVGGKKVVR